MTLDEAIIDIKDNIKPVVGGISLDMAIDTMRKYQQIEQIYKVWFSNKDRTGAYAYERIGEILKDGNVD